ncbi:hypothetical protein DICPUDRAFT_160168 [Dictyostelium purpureum]|uniref:Uncharacterized protein n=1 Tax=Dictyostelium purpureum TaxID=5786 RepID=F1A5U7_DICPU|nr:uncharacterized protein DICPUDRAFT_160168 [Dictyostelium purpureum]EGC28433.1 hypothetical protein DICPUDRAFT_160168 [Dictyostelium purpureum]|eukprot:XP_003295038.1 hypothetical protein DICPUDRAFT_160168 [Dictyostelium purpureum]
MIRRLVEIEQQFQSNNTTYKAPTTTQKELYIDKKMECYKCKVIFEEGLDSDFECV